MVDKRHKHHKHHKDHKEHKLWGWGDYRLILLALLGIMLMLLGTLGDRWGGGAGLEKDRAPLPAATGESPGYPGCPSRELEQRLAKILEQVEGVSRVSVLLSYYSGSLYTYVSDREESWKETLEGDGEGGSRDIQEGSQSEQLVLRRGNQGQEEPVLREEVYPRVKGALVVARGVEDPHRKSRVIEAVQAVLDLPSHKVIVLPGGD